MFFIKTKKLVIIRCYVPVVSGGKVEGRGLPAIGGVAVHVQRGQQGQQLLLIATPILYRQCWLNGSCSLGY